MAELPDRCKDCVDLASVRSSLVQGWGCAHGKSPLQESLNDRGGEGWIEDPYDPPPWWCPQRQTEDRDAD